MLLRMKGHDWWMDFGIRRASASQIVIDFGHDYRILRRVRCLQVSLISKIVPSPDWFLGIDSVDLCDAGRWVDSVHLQVSASNKHNNCHDKELTSILVLERRNNAL